MRRDRIHELLKSIPDSAVQEWMAEFGEREIFTLDDAKEAMFICRSSGGVNTLVRAIAAALARMREADHA